MKAKTAIVVGVVAVVSVGTVGTVKYIIPRTRMAQLKAAGGGDPQQALALLRATIWPMERQATAERIKARQVIDETHGATPVNLSLYYNAQLTNAPVCWKGNDQNNLSEVPKGLHVYGGVPFDVEGAIYLTGGWLKEHYHKNYPVKVSNIRIDRTCEKIHLLHGGAYILASAGNTTVAKLALHYADGVVKSLDIVAGKHLWDMWEPTFQTGVPPQCLHTDPGSEMAWIGSNPYLEKWQPDLTLVLYKSTFQNPRPTATLASVDYISTETITVPFMVGMTVE